MKKSFLFITATFIIAFQCSYSQTSWTKLNTGVTDFLWGIHFPSANIGYACGLNGRIIKTSDGGTTWVTQTTTSTSFLQDIYFFDENEGICIGFNGEIMKTFDGGQSWTDPGKIESGTFNNLTRMFFNGQYGTIVGDGGIMLISSSKGDSWTLATNSPTVNKINDIVYADANTGYMVGDMNDVFKTTDGGQTWVLQTPSFAETNTSFKLSVVDANTVFFCGGVSRIFKTTNGGNTWQNKTNTTATFYRSIYFQDASTGWVAGQGGKIINTTNGGSTFTSQNSGVTDNLNDITVSPAQDAYICGENGVIIKKSIAINPAANFSTTINQLDVQFTDLTTNNPTSWLWTFGDATTSTQQNPLHTYNGAGTYNVCLIVSNSAGGDTICKNITVSSLLPPTADFTFTSNELNVAFTDLSFNGPTTWLWDFGDSTVNATAQHPTHLYNATGTYKVCLTVSNLAGNDSACKSIQIITIGVYENTLKQEIKIYPNPVYGGEDLVIHLPNSYFSTLTVIDNVGREAGEYSIVGSQPINTGRSLRKGIYQFILRSKYSMKNFSVVIQ